MNPEAVLEQGRRLWLYGAPCLPTAPVNTGSLLAFSRHDAMFHPPHELAKTTTQTNDFETDI